MYTRKREWAYIRSIWNQFPEENILITVKWIDDNIHKPWNFSLKLKLLRITAKGSLRNRLRFPSFTHISISKSQINTEKHRNIDRNSNQREIDTSWQHLNRLKVHEEQHRVFLPPLVDLRLHRNYLPHSLEIFDLTNKFSFSKRNPPLKWNVRKNYS